MLRRCAAANAAFFCTSCASLRNKKAFLSHICKRRKGFVFRGTTLIHLTLLVFTAPVSNALISSVTGSPASAYSCSAAVSFNEPAAHDTFTKRTPRPVQSICLLPRISRQFSVKHFASTIPYLRLSHIPVYYKKIIQRSQVHFFLFLLRFLLCCFR